MPITKNFHIGRCPNCGHPAQSKRVVHGYAQHRCMLCGHDWAVFLYLEDAMIEKFKAATIRQEISSRGGGIEIRLDDFGFPGEWMIAYQNYLGGGMLGSIGSDCSLKHKTTNITVLDAHKLDVVTEDLKRYFHSIGSSQDTPFNELQRLPVSAF